MAWAATERQRIHTAVLAIHKAFGEGVPLDLAIQASNSTPGEDVAIGNGASPLDVDWPSLIEGFREYKLSSGAIKPSTWQSIYRRRMAAILEAAGGKRRPVSPNNSWKRSLVPGRIDQGPGDDSFRSSSPPPYSDGAWIPSGYSPTGRHPWIFLSM